jgi:hypothetical protein
MRPKTKPRTLSQTGGESGLRSFSKIKEHRGLYFVEYGPPIPDTDFATLNLIFLQSLPREDVVKYLGDEIRHWIGRYPVPLMVWAFDDKEDILESPDGKERVLVAWNDAATGEVVLSWNIDDLSAHLNSVRPSPDWRTIYTDVSVRTDAEVKQAADQSFRLRVRQVRSLKLLLTLWLAAIPAGYAVFEFFGPGWLALIGLTFVLWKASKTALRIWGRTKPSAKENEKAEKDRKMRHYFYHCERNPDGFLRLKLENFEDDSRERVRKDAKGLAKNSHRQ